MRTLLIHAIPNRRIHAQTPSNAARANCGRKLAQDTELIRVGAEGTSQPTCNHCLHQEAGRPAPTGATVRVRKTNKAAAAPGHQS